MRVQPELLVEYGIRQCFCMIGEGKLGHFCLLMTGGTLIDMLERTNQHHDNKSCAFFDLD